MNKLKDIIRQAIDYRLARHTAFWIVFLLLDVFQHLIVNSEKLEEFGGFSAAFIFNIIALIPQIAFAYFLCYVVLPLLFRKTHTWLGILLAAAGIYLFAAFSRVMMVYVAEELVIDGPFPQESFHEIFTDWKFLLSRYIPSNIWVALIFIATKYLYNYEIIRRKDLELMKEKTESELKALKSQINPHFLFNTLNNIYSLSIENSPKTPESISKLSDMLDHILYRTEGKVVPLSGEIELINNFIELEQLRYDERLRLKMNTSVDQALSIPPLVLLSLVENAFKHGAAKDSGSPEIDIDIKNFSEKLLFKISNSVSGHVSEEISESIGLSNIRKQLDLIYDNDYDLEISRGDKLFTVLLQINNAV